MKNVTLSFILLALAFPAMSADIAKDPAIFVEGEQGQHADQVNRGNVAVVSIIDDTFTDLAPIYADALVANGCTPDIYYDPGGSVDYSGYDLILVTVSDNWWSSDTYPLEILAWSSYMDSGGKIILIGQDFLSGSGNYIFTTVFCAMGAVTEDINYSDDTPMSVIGRDVMDGYLQTMLPCFEVNDWFTDEIVSAQHDICTWGTLAYPGPYNGGSASMVGIFSVVEFACGGAVNHAIARLTSWLMVTPAEEKSISAVKTLY